MTGVLDRLGILTDEVSDNFDDALAWIAANGLKHVEVRVVEGRNIAELTDAEQIRSIRQRVEARGLFISAIASPLFKCALDPTRLVASGDRFGQGEEGVEAHFAKLDRVIRTAKLLATRRIRIFSFWREREPAEHRDEVVAHLKRAAAVAERADVLLLVENEVACNGGYAAEVADLVRGVASPAVRALWDPGNEAYGGREAFPAGYESLKDVFAHMHLKDAYVRADGSSKCVPIGTGNVAFIPQLQALAGAGYNGLFTIETHFTPVGGTRKMGSLMTLRALRTLLQEVQA